ncbi:MAG: TadE family protein [Candidatus Dormiibacterota bacterium]
MVEFALIAPAFFILVLTIIEAALFFSAQSTIDNSTREVARAVAVCGTTKGQWYYQRDNTGAWIKYPDCKSAAQAQEHLGFLPDNGPVLAVCVGGDIPDNGRCQSGYQQPTAVGQTIEVDIYYTYRWYVYPLFGEVGPTTVIKSSARVQAQQ